MKPSQQFLEHSAYTIRVDSVRATTQAGSGHATSALSAADLLAGLFFYSMGPEDHFILSKGHAAPGLYAAFKVLGLITDQELMGLRTFDSVLEGHPTPRSPYIEVATGSLGQGLSIGAGQALAQKLDKKNNTIYVMLGDSELTEGSNWEAAEIAAYYQLNNLVAVLDCNRWGQSTATIEGHDLERYSSKFEAFGWNTFVIDGHNMHAIMQALDHVKQLDTNQPTIIIAKTFKGYGLNGTIEDHNGYHGKAFSTEELPELLERLQQRFLDAHSYQPTQSEREYSVTRSGAFVRKNKPPLPKCIVPVLGESPTQKMATRKAYGQALVALGAVCSEVVSLDAEVKNSTFAELFEQKYPERFFQCFIAEQNMISMGVGFFVRGKIPFISTFAAFFTRAHDQIRMAAIGRAALRLVGSHAGVSIGQDGPSQMGLEDIALMRGLPESIILYPCDRVSTYKCVELMANYHAGISYLRTTRSETPVIYSIEESFEIGGYKILKQSDHDVVCVVAAGITVFEALEAYKVLAQEDIFISVLDCYSIKPLPTKALRDLVQKSHGRVITVEDHYRQGGLGEAISYELRNNNVTIQCLAVNKLPRSGTGPELCAFEEIDAQAIIKAVKHMLF